MPETKETSVPKAPKPPDELGKVEDLNELQRLARDNTRTILALRREAEEEDDEAKKDVLEKQIVEKRRRSTAIVNRRNQIQKKQDEEKKQREAAQYDEWMSKLKPGGLEKRRVEVTKMLQELGQDAEEAQRKARGPEQRDLARRLLALTRAAYAGYEAIRRVPKLHEEADEE